MKKKRKEVVSASDVKKQTHPAYVYRNALLSRTNKRVRASCLQFMSNRTSRTNFSNNRGESDRM